MPEWKVLCVAYRQQWQEAIIQVTRHKSLKLFAVAATVAEYYYRGLVYFYDVVYRIRKENRVYKPVNRWTA